MTIETPLGKRESQTLEFKRAAVLQEPFDVARAVVAMCNADGGTIWIGVVEKDGVAVELEDIADVERRRQRLRDHLVESIEPDADGAEPEVVVVPTGEHLLRLRVRPKVPKRWYAAVRKGLRYFGRRVGDRVRPMTHAELFETGATSDAEKLERLQRRREEVLKRGRSVLWIAVQPVEDVDLDLDRFRELLSDPKSAGNRRSGWTPHSRYETPRTDGERLVLGKDEGKFVAIHADGLMELQVPLTQIHHGRTEGVLHALALLEYSVSFLRVVAHVLGTMSTKPECLVDIALVGTKGWRLPAFSTGTYGEIFDHEPPRELRDVVLHAPLRMSGEQLVSAPDAAGYRIVRRIYQWFDLPEDRIPAQYDRATERLKLTD